MQQCALFTSDTDTVRQFFAQDGMQVSKTVLTSFTWAALWVIHSPRACSKKNKSKDQMEDFCMMPVGGEVDSRSSPDSSASAGPLGIVRGSGQPSARSRECLTMPAAVKCVLAHTDASATLQAALRHQVHDRGRYRCTKWTKQNPDTKLPEVTQSTHGNR